MRPFRVWILGGACLVGCATSPDDNEGDSAFWRTFLAGEGEATAGGATSTQGWLVTGAWDFEAGAEVPCVEDEDPETDSCPISTYRSDGRLVTSNERGTFGFPAYAHTWEVSGDELTVTTESSANTFVSVTRLEDLGLVAGKRRVRFHGISDRDPTGTYSSEGRSTSYEEATDENLAEAM